MPTRSTRPPTGDGEARGLDLPRTRTALHRPVPGPARAVDRAARPLRAHAGGRRLLARRRAPAPAAAHLRHGLGVGEGARRPPAPPGGGRAARPPQLGAELDLFSLPRRDRLGAGRLPPQGRHHPPADGGLLARSVTTTAGYQFVYTPHITKAELFEISGHLDWFAEGMFPPMELDGGHRYYLKPMNCPFHILIYKSRQRSYRELPMRLFEFGTVYRYEKSGVVHGLTRVRGMTQDDSHIFCTREQMADELDSLLTFVLGPAARLRTDDFYLELSTRPEGKAVGTDEEWDEATEALRTVADGDGPRARARTRGAAPSTGRRSRCRPATPSAGPGRCRPSSSTSRTAAALRPGVRRRRQRPPPAGHDPPGPVRLGRAVLRHPARALRRRPAHLAGARAGARAPVRDDHEHYAHEVADRWPRPGLRVSVEPADEPLGGPHPQGQAQKVPTSWWWEMTTSRPGPSGSTGGGASGPSAGCRLVDFVDTSGTPRSAPERLVPTPHVSLEHSGPVGEATTSPRPPREPAVTGDGHGPRRRRSASSAASRPAGPPRPTTGWCGGRRLTFVRAQRLPLRQRPSAGAAPPPPVGALAELTDDEAVGAVGDHPPAAAALAAAYRPGRDEPRRQPGPGRRRRHPPAPAPACCPAGPATPTS